jgi:hypothetical protein
MTPQPVTFVYFTERYRLRLKRDACGDLIAPGKFGHLYEHAAGLFGAVLEEDRNGPSRVRSLLVRRRKALAADFRLHQAGDAEAILLFELGNAFTHLASFPFLTIFAGCPSPTHFRRRLPGHVAFATLHR